jgi:hypothetical protein
MGNHLPEGEGTLGNCFARDFGQIVIPPDDVIVDR